MFAAARDLPKRPTHIQTHTHPLSSADVSVVGKETCDKRQREMEIKKIQITLLSELPGLVQQYLLKGLCLLHLKSLPDTLVLDEPK